MKIIEIILQIDYIIPLTILDKFLKKKGFHLIHMNARSLVSNFTLIQPIIENSNIDICTVSESWLHDLIPDKFIEIPGYQIVRQDRNRIAYVTLSAKTSLMLGVHKAGFRREGHIW